MSLRQDWSTHPCPIARSLDVVGDPWVMLILREALFGERRFERFRHRLQVADNVLSRRLNQMVDAGLLRRESYRGKQRTHDEYVITEAGADLLPVLDALAQWGEKHTQTPPAHSRMSIMHGDHRTASPATCTTCGAALTAADRSYQREWIPAAAGRP
ncbi:winged helix-turn-helix transcriptional regulator [Actinocrispum wychmicini]|uniref:HxlR family transcriptional regulator n=1 Tax=Actinocrispum wychmicini TaxID=1213861 RepID=A0A4R2IX06_9PSEU|nr:helix-turn-helix domain-containing protein [Actinocrispum wychmicini]TCO48996.1 HxlR family transcriptional regulator [Actinocrispum wychmicini]